MAPLKNNNSRGYDDVPILVLKSIKEEILYILSH